MAVKGTYLMIAAGGGLLLWSGLKGKAWSTVLRDILAGKNPQTTLTAYPVTGTPVTGGDVVGSAGTGISGGKVSFPAIGPISRGKNVALGRVMAAAYGWTGAQWTALNELWTQESGWNNHAQNPSGAYGIPQGLPPSKMGRLANPPFSSAVAQIRWGLSYIRQRYGNPVNAWNHEVANGWY